MWKLVVGQRTVSTAIARYGRRNRGFLRSVPAVLSERKIQRKDVHRLHQGPQQAHQATQQRREERRRQKDQSPRTVVNTRSIAGNVSVSIRVFKGPRLLFCREMVLIVHGFPNDVSALRVCCTSSRDAFFFYCQSLFFSSSSGHGRIPNCPDDWNTSRPKAGPKKCTITAFVYSPRC